MRIFSFGGGVQSTAALVLAAQGRLQYDAFVFSNVGADSENPETLAYIEQYTRPYADAHGLNLIEVQRTRRDGSTDTLVQRLTRTPGFNIPARFPNGMPGNRNCTEDFKVLVVDKWLRKQNVTHAIVGLGISLDEFTRARDTDWHDQHGNGKKPRRLGFWRKREYPLLDLRLSRQDCFNIVYREGLPVPPKSSCYFCPFKRAGEWLELKTKRPDLFDKAVALEKHINDWRVNRGQPPLYMHRFVKPLDEATSDQLPLFEDDGCESGYCMT